MTTDHMTMIMEAERAAFHRHLQHLMHADRRTPLMHGEAGVLKLPDGSAWIVPVEIVNAFEAMRPSPEKFKAHAAGVIQEIAIGVGVVPKLANPKQRDRYSRDLAELGGDLVQAGLMKRSPAPVGPKAVTADEAKLALRRHLPNVGDRVALRDICDTASSAYMTCWSMDGIRGPFKFIAPTAKTGPERFAHMERVRRDDEPSPRRRPSGAPCFKDPPDSPLPPAVAKKNGTEAAPATPAPRRVDVPAEMVRIARGPAAAPPLPAAVERVARIERERAERHAIHGTDLPESGKGMQLTDGRRRQTRVSLHSATLDDGEGGGLPPGVTSTDLKRVLNRLSQLMPKVGDSIEIAHHFTSGPERMAARQVCRADRRFTLYRSQQNAKRIEGQ